MPLRNADAVWSPFSVLFGTHSRGNLVDTPAVLTEARAYPDYCEICTRRSKMMEGGDNGYDLMMGEDLGLGGTI